MITSGGPRNSAPDTLNRLFFDAVQKFDKSDALQVKVGGKYQPISHRTLGDRVAILSENRPEWAIGDYACLTSALADVPIYPNLPPEQVAYILRDCGAVAIFVSTTSQADKVRQIRRQC